MTKYLQCVLLTFMRNGKSNQNSLCGMMSVPVLSNLNLSMMAPTMKYVATPSIALYTCDVYIISLSNYSYKFILTN